MALTDKLTAIADAIRAKGGTSELLTLEGMVDAISAISAGGGGTQQRGSFTIASDVNEYRITGLSGTPSAFAVAPAFTKDEALDGVSKIIAFIWVCGVLAALRTNSGGTSITIDYSDVFSLDAYSVYEDDYNFTDSSVAATLTSGFYVKRSGYYFRAGTTYNWAAIV